MTPEDKVLLFQDLCSRLPYYPKCEMIDEIRVVNNEKDSSYISTLFPKHIELFSYHNDFTIKPYLRPMSSMTEEEKSELLIHILGNKKATKYFQVMPDGSIDQSDSSIQELSNFTLHWLNFDGINTSSYIDWLNAHHFDYRGLIPKGLAIKVTKENNPYK